MSTRLHNVREEPLKESRIVGHLLADRQILALAEVGEWLKVEWHLASEDMDSGIATRHGTGWAL
eukprot:CAMPEP_0172590598 /NCGR_PEP_ID=MMETSP1068-20121228/9150_1 /TAXON_ID=35684 /ORGANISM="Pseudopedinella elastica, Strain CCMP716" /LENGTH=63 /DNA_ID=CAMNT_0013386555 /DNA_START=38 /DNA_END=226 /DNA_ORIENTATION=-